MPAPEGCASPAYPALITAAWCPYPAAARGFWSHAARSAGASLAVFDAGTEEGARVLLGERVAGVPCLLARPGERHYGLQYTLEDAERILREATAVSSTERH